MAAEFAATTLLELAVMLTVVALYDRVVLLTTGPFTRTVVVGGEADADNEVVVGSTQQTP